MSFFHQTSAGTARARRTKEREGHPRASSVNNNGRRHGTSTKTQDNRSSPPSKSPVLQGSIYSQQNLMLDQMPGTSSTETSLSAPISPTSSIYQSNNHRGGVIHLSQQPYTPIALQQYLDEDQDNDDDDDKHQEEDLKLEKKTSKSSDAAVVTASTNSTNTEKSQFRTSLGQKENLKPSTIESRNSLYKVNSAHQNEHSEPSTSHRKSVLEMTRDMTPSKDHKAIVQQSNKVDRFGTEVPADNAMQVDLDKPVEYGSIPSLKSSDDATTLVSMESQRRPLSQITNNTDINIVGSENAELQAFMMRTISQQSVPFVSRTFTPPAPPVGSSRAPAQTSPVFVSPIPIRSRMTGDNYTTAYAPPPHYPSYQTPSNPLVSENYPNYPGFQDYTDFQSMPHTQHPGIYANIPNAPQSVLSEIQVAHQYPPGEQNDNPFVLISKLLSALPELQMFIAQCQQSGMDNGYNLLGLRGSEGQNDASMKYQVLEEKIKKDEQRHKEQIIELTTQVTDLQTRLKYMESDLADSRKSRDDLYEELVVQRIESASTIKMLLNEKDDLKKRFDDACITAEEKAKGQLLVLRGEIDREKKQGKELELQIKELQASHEAQQHDASCAFDRKHNELVELHGQTVQNLEAQLDKELIKGSTLARQLEELEQKLEHERKCLSDQYDHDRRIMTKTFEEKTTSLRGDYSRSMEENTKVVKELDDVRKVAASDRARFLELAQRFKDAACKINQENTNLQKIMTACGAMAADSQNRNNG